jgi:hypothetical protein
LISILHQAALSKDERAFPPADVAQERERAADVRLRTSESGNVHGRAAEQRSSEARGAFCDRHRECVVLRVALGERDNEKALRRQDEGVDGISRLVVLGELLFPHGSRPSVERCARNLRANPPTSLALTLNASG